ncbi:bifunctional 4-hydroxy-2-oxoglutarate aldolase/2-dehydro-3-deoxy-phosphogluconate aldolase [Herbiconiux moechotypicola]|uniref:bifunctional 4-hydroxy-2-oxoglutarate aldolase/2-dehydro-3-deoxy-phosphogluconate aldolase n=1 Tax=Herbiconiux moechotypicola TaxID=637393 RepID=UPI00217E978E|nr:bifunctional 4-hydroxy-2-oxoglutarate aldolase/2-dehydro-3-deoxy-phosphogluconate aldolase [Herbiconiux moechotypicola]
MTPSDAFRERLRSELLMPIIRASTAEHVRAAADTLIDAGFRLFEVSLTTPDAVRLIRELAAIGGGVSIGAGTVLTADDAHRVADAGAEFVVTPGLVPSIEAAHALGLPTAVGALTPTEIIAADAAGASVVKIFPAELGGPGYLSAVRAPLPGIPLVPVGGVTVESAREYFRRGAAGAGLGSPLLGDAAEGGSLAALAERSHAFLALAEEVRG